MDTDHISGGLDPQALTTAQIKSLLDKYKVEYPADVRKPKLIRLYKKHVLGREDPETNASISNASISNASISNHSVKGPDWAESALREPSPFDGTTQVSGKVLKPEKKKKKPKKSKATAEHSAIANTSGSRESEHVKAEVGKPGTKPSSGLAPGVLGTKAEAKSGGDLEPGLGSKPSGATTNKQSPREPGSKKRKSTLGDIDTKASETPSKGTMFDIDSGSELEGLSPNVKRLRTAKTKADSPDGWGGRRQGSEPLSARGAGSPAESASTLPAVRGLGGDSEAASAREDTPSAEEQVGTFNAEQADEASEEKSQEAKRQAPSVAAPRSQRSEIEISASDSGDSSEFDSALLKLKATHAPSQVPESKNVELAKLFNIDPKRIKPKPRSARAITPRRPIIISESLLDHRGDELSEEDVPEKRARPAPTEFYNNSDASSELDADADADSADLTLQSIEKAPPPPHVDQIKAEKGRGWPSLFRFLLYLVVWLGLVGLSLFAYWYREQSFYVGYCGNEIDKTTIPPSHDTPRFLVVLGEYLDSNFKPQCVECPQHARCFAKLEMACYDDFYRHTPWYYKIYPGINPQAQYCVPDTKKAEKIEIMIDVALDLLRARNANKDCGRAPESDYNAGISVDDLHSLLLSMKAPYITEEEFEDLWQRSVSELEKEAEIIVRQVTPLDAKASNSSPEASPQKHLLTIQVGLSGDHLGPEPNTNHTAPAQNSTVKVLRSTALSNVSLKCMMSNTLFGIVVRFKRFLAIGVVVSLLGLVAYYRYKAFSLQAQKVDTLYAEVLRRLQKQAKVSHASGNVPAYIGSIHLRDLILSTENNLSRKMRLWQAVSRKVDRNTNVSHQLIEVHGEVMKVWEWISVLDD